MWICHPRVGLENIILPLSSGLKTRILLNVAVDTPFLTDLKTQMSPIERSVVLHTVLIQKSQSRGREPCLRTSELSFMPCLGLRTGLGFLCFLSCREGEV